MHPTYPHPHSYISTPIFIKSLSRFNYLHELFPSYLPLNRLLADFPLIHKIARIPSTSHIMPSPNSATPLYDPTNPLHRKPTTGCKYPLYFSLVFILTKQLSMLHPLIQAINHFPIPKLKTKYHSNGRPHHLTMLHHHHVGPLWTQDLGHQVEQHQLPAVPGHSPVPGLVGLHLHGRGTGPAPGL